MPNLQTLHNVCFYLIFVWLLQNTKRPAQSNVHSQANEMVKGRLHSNVQFPVKNRKQTALICAARLLQKRNGHFKLYHSTMTYAPPPPEITKSKLKKNYREQLRTAYEIQELITYVHFHFSRSRSCARLAGLSLT